jgi:hypothetical protein
MTSGANISSVTIVNDVNDASAKNFPAVSSKPVVICHRWSIMTNTFKQFYQSNLKVAAIVFVQILAGSVDYGLCSSFANFSITSNFV